MLAFLGPVSLNNDYSQWVDGFFANVAFDLGGQGLQIFMTIGAMVSTLGQFNALLCVSAQELRALGKKDMMGIRALAWKHPKLRTPWLAIVINTVLCGIVSVLPFSQLVQIDNALYAVVMLMEYTALVRMRYTHKDMKRPFRISQSIVPTLMLISPAILFCVYIIIATCMSVPEGDDAGNFPRYIQPTMFFSVLVVGSLTYLLIWLVRNKCNRKPNEGNVN